MPERERERELQVASIVQTTTDYGQFKYIESNRPVSKDHVQRLVTSFEKNPTLIATRPILVNENLEIIDGQHRLQACMFLRIPVHYIVAEGTDIAAAQTMNAIQRNWNLMDYARSYALAGNEHYRTFLNYLDEYPIPGTTLMYYLLGKQAKFANREFRMGKFKVQDDRKRVNDMLEHLADLGNGFYYWRDYDFAAAVLSIQNVEGYDPQRMLTKLKEDPSVLVRQASRVDYLRLLEGIYNRKFSDENRLRFF